MTTPIPLPTRDGISPNSVFLPKGTWATVLDFFAARFADVSAARWQERMARGEVVSADGAVITPQSPYQCGIRVYYYREIDNELQVPFSESILFEDDNILIADKPHFLPTAPSGRYLKETLVSRLKHKLGLDHLVPLHRLDRETAGLLMVSKNIATRDAYHALFREQRLEKTYEAIAAFREEMVFPFTRRSRIVDAEEFYRRREAPGEPNAITIIDVIEQREGMARYRLQPITGKTHQLRVHMSALGIPIRNDPYYPEQKGWRGDDFSHPLQLLARTLEFVDPVTGEARSFESRQTLMPAWWQGPGR
ncbi:MAG: pseudouridine synthase [bacterium]|nr:pseudouridine synthase [bacterium]